MKSNRTLLAALLLVSLAGNASAEHWTKPYNIVWTTPGTKGYDSMPAGGGNISLNVWAEKDDVVFYIGSPDSFDATEKLTKLARIRVKVSPNPFAGNLRQELDLETNTILVSGRASDGTEVRLSIRADVHQPVVHVEGTASKPVEVTAALELLDAWKMNAKAADIGVLWSRRVPSPSVHRAMMIKRWALESIAQKVPDPLGNLTCGGLLTGEGFAASQTGKELSIRTLSPTEKFGIRAVLRMAQDDTMEAWESAVSKLAETTKGSREEDQRKSVDWWRAFWDRSWIVINPDANNPDDKPWQVGRNYQLFRAMLAANSSGKFPSFFNGGPFTCGENPDKRKWDFCKFMAQNQRHLFWPLFKSGDADLLRVGTGFYSRTADLQRARVREKFGIDGVIYDEGLNTMGLGFAPGKDGLNGYKHLRYHFTSGMEFVLMMLEAHRYFGEDLKPHLPAIEGTLRFFDAFYRKEDKSRTGTELDAQGRLVIYPGNALELYEDTRNATDAVSGLMAVSDGLLALPAGEIPAETRSWVEAFRKTLPPIAKREFRGHTVIAPAESWAREGAQPNAELPQLYPVFPFGIYGVGKPDLQLARDTWWHGGRDETLKTVYCWFQGNIFVAALGLTGEARLYALSKFLFPQDFGLNYNPWKHPIAAPRTRYPVFWDTPQDFCEIPDMDHGGSAMVGLQEMLLQTDGRKILLFPAWPKDWDVDFKLHAPGQTTVEAKFRNGKIEKLVVDPPSRAADLVDMSGVEAPPLPPFFGEENTGLKSLRHCQTINRDWRFLLGDKAGAEAVGFDDGTWERIGLPHSFSIPYFRSKDFYIGYGWYRKTLDIPAEWIPGKSVFLEFDGVFQEAEVFVNGLKTGHHEGGYTGFSVDVTKAIHPGPNSLAIRVNNLWKARLAPRAGEHVFSGGIYRNVRLVATDRLHVAWYGTWVTTLKVSARSATVNVKTEVVNDSGKPRSCGVRTEIVDPDGKVVCRFESSMHVAGNATVTFDQTSAPLADPKLWHPDHPHLYNVRTTVLDEGRPVDSYESPLGFRWFEWTADRGFFLNGEHYYFRGANVHQDHAGWGDAVTDTGAWRDVSLVKEAGFDFIRGSHYPHSPAFSEACDRQGMLFWSENCFWGTGGSKGNGYWDSSAYPTRPEDGKPFEESVRASLREMIRIHRNHPSIVVWSMCNEVFFTSPETMPTVRRFLKELVDYSHELDPARPAAIGGAQRGDLHKLGDIAGLNGDGASLPQFINTGIPSVISEYGSTMDDRPGAYAPGWGDLPRVPAQDKTQPYAWRYPWRSGEALWCAFDHGSIAGPRFGGMGMLDYFRLPKRQWYWYRNAYRGIPPPAWPEAGVPAGVTLEADKTTLCGADGTDDALLVATVVDREGRALSNVVPVTLAVESGPGEFPTGRTITFEPDSDIAIRDGKAAIEFRTYEAGESVIRASAPGLKPALLRIRTGGAPVYVEGRTPAAGTRPYVRYVRASDHRAATVAMEFGSGNPTRVSGSVKEHAASLANDGDKSSYWQSPDDQPEAWWQVDLERVVAVSRVRLRFPQDGERRYRIGISEDGARWATIVDRTQAPVSGVDRPEEIAPGPVARWVRVTFTGLGPGQPATLAEMGVSGCLAGCDPERKGKQ